MTNMYLHPARSSGDAPPGTILVSDKPDDDEGVALIQVDPGNNRIPLQEAEIIADQICQRWNQIQQGLNAERNFEMMLTQLLYKLRGNSDPRVGVTIERARGLLRRKGTPGILRENE